MITDVYAHILDEDRKINAQKFEASFYAQNCNTLKNINVPDTIDPDITKLLVSLQQSPELVSALTEILKSNAIRTN